MQRFHRNVRRLFKSQEHGIAWSSSKLACETLTDQNVSIPRSIDTGDAVEFPKPVVHAIHLHSTHTSFTRFVYYHGFKRDQRTRSSNAVIHKLPGLHQIVSKLFAEEDGGRNHIISVTQPPRREIAK